MDPHILNEFNKAKKHLNECLREAETHYNPAINIGVRVIVEDALTKLSRMGNWNEVDEIELSQLPVQLNLLMELVPKIIEAAQVSPEIFKLSDN